MIVALRAVTDGDLPIFFEHQREPEATRMAAFPPRDRDAFMTHWTKVLGDETNITRTVVADEIVAGNIVSWRDSKGKRLVGYWIGREHWGKGIATLALLEFVREVTERPLYAYVAAHNVASIRVLQKCGFAVTDDDDPAPTDAVDDVEELLLRLEE